jgi:propane monooxygenase coupling protein
MSTKPNVTVMALPSMIRVDAVGRMEVDYDEVSEALGEEPGFFDAAEFEENMSTHYGRMIHLDDRTIMVANPEDAAEELGFDLTASGS